MTTTPHGQVPEALTYERDRAIMEGERNASLDAYSRVVLLTSAESRLYEAAFTNGWDRCATHVQNPAENEHVAGDVSKNSAKKNMNDYAELPEPDATTVGLGAVWNRHSMRDFADATHALRTQQPAPAGDWLWCKLMDFCKKRGFAPANFNDLFEIVAAARAEQPAPATQQAGWKCAPVEPTDAMVQAAHHIDLSYMPGQEGADRAAIYRAMLAAAPHPSPTAQADSQPATDEIVSMAREQGLPETEIEGVFRVNADDLRRVVAAVRAARKQGGAT